MLATAEEGQSAQPEASTSKPAVAVAETAPKKAQTKQQQITGVEKEITKMSRKLSGTFAPNASRPAKKNPAQPGTGLFNFFIWQGYLSGLFGGLLCFQLLFPSDHPDPLRFLGVWSIWMLTIPSIRACEVTRKEKDALDFLFLAMPLLNVAIPFVNRSFALVWSADVVLYALAYVWKGVWVLPFEVPFLKRFLPQPELVEEVVAEPQQQPRDSS